MKLVVTWSTPEGWSVPVNLPGWWPSPGDADLNRWARLIKTARVRLGIPRDAVVVIREGRDGEEGG